jgi:hypothetical protein
MHDVTHSLRRHEKPREGHERTSIIEAVVYLISSRISTLILVKWAMVPFCMKSILPNLNGWQLASEMVPLDAVEARGECACVSL